MGWFWNGPNVVLAGEVSDEELMSHVANNCTDFSGMASGVTQSQLSDVGCIEHDMPDGARYCIECGYPWNALEGTPSNPAIGETTRL